MSSFLAGRGWFALLPFPALLAWWLLSRREELGPSQPVGQVWTVTLTGTVLLYCGLVLARAMARGRVGGIFGMRRCQNGHLVPGFARLCERCGAPVLNPERSKADDGDDR